MFEKHFFGAAFLNRSTNDILGQLILCRGDCRVHCRMFSVIPDSHPLDVSSTYAVVTCKNVYRPCPFSSGVRWEDNQLPCEYYCFRAGILFDTLLCWIWKDSFVVGTNIVSCGKNRNRVIETWSLVNLVCMFKYLWRGK